jgi:hypothetical protein
MALKFGTKRAIPLWFPVQYTHSRAVTRLLWSSGSSSSSQNEQQSSQNIRSHPQKGLVERQASLPDVRGIPVATSNWKALEKLDLGIWEYARWNGDVCGIAKEAIEQDPTCILAYSLNALHLLSHRSAAASHPEVLAAMKTSRQLLSSQ